MDQAPLRVGIFGAGAIGAYLGVALASRGCEVVMIGRPWLEALAGRLEARDIAGVVHRPEARLTVTTEPEALAGVELCLVTVKSRHTGDAAAALAGVLPPDTTVVSLQNGLGNAQRLRDGGLPRALGGMVGFNVFQDDARFTQATSSPLIIARAQGQDARRLARLSEALGEVGQAVALRPDIEAVQAGKLLINLNNAVCALSGLSIADSLRSRPLRRSFAASMREGLSILKAAGIRPAPVGKLAPGLIARLLPLPDAVVLRVAPSLVQIDPRARSSTLQDLEAGKPTEIDHLNGALVALAREHNLPAPINGWITDTLHDLERAGLPVPFLTPEAIWSHIGALQR